MFPTCSSVILLYFLPKELLSTVQKLTVKSVWFPCCAFFWQNFLLFAFLKFHQKCFLSHFISVLLLLFWYHELNKTDLFAETLKRTKFVIRSFCRLPLGNQTFSSFWANRWHSGSSVLIKNIVSCMIDCGAAEWILASYNTMLLIWTMDEISPDYPEYFYWDHENGRRLIWNETITDWDQNGMRSKQIETKME